MKTALPLTLLALVASASARNDAGGKDPSPTLVFRLSPR